MNRIAATAPSESQKLGAIIAHGSSGHTTEAATASVVSGRMPMRSQTAAATTSNMKIVRCAGMPQPANRQ